MLINLLCKLICFFLFTTVWTFLAYLSFDKNKVKKAFLNICKYSLLFACIDAVIFLYLIMFELFKTF